MIGTIVGILWQVFIVLLLIFFVILALQLVISPIRAVRFIERVVFFWKPKNEFDELFDQLEDMPMAQHNDGLTPHEAMLLKYLIDNRPATIGDAAIMRNLARNELNELMDSISKKKKWKMPKDIDWWRTSINWKLE